MSLNHEATSWLVIAGAYWTGLVAVAALAAVWGRRAARRRQTQVRRINPRSRWLFTGITGVVIVGFVVAWIFQGIFRLQAAQVRSHLFDLKEPIARRVTPEATVIRIPPGTITPKVRNTLLQKAREARARAIVFLVDAPVPEDPMATMRHLGPLDARLHSALTQTPRGAASPPATRGYVGTATVYVFAPDADPIDPLPAPAVGHLLVDPELADYPTISLRYPGADRKQFPSLCVLLAAGLTGSSLQDFDWRRNGDLIVSGLPVPLLGRSRLLAAVDQPSGLTEALNVRNVDRFCAQMARGVSPLLDASWEDLLRNRIAIVTDTAPSQRGFDIPLIAYRGANTLAALIRYGDGARLQHTWIPSRVRGPWSAVFLVLVVLFSGVYQAMVRPVPGLVLMLLGGIGLWLATASLYIAFAVMLPLTPALAGMVVTGVFARETSYYLVEERQSRVMAIFDRYVSSEVGRQLLKADSIDLGGEAREVSVMFADIRGFGSWAESLDPEALVDLLNAYFGTMVDVVFEFQGALDKFIGDETMAVWGAPLDQPDHAALAARAALEMQRRVNLMSGERERSGLPVAGITIGVNSGQAIAGNVGHVHRMEYTVIGDQVNIAKRLQALASDENVQIVISEATRSRIPGDVEARPLGSIAVKHRDELVEAFALKSITLSPPA